MLILEVKSEPIRTVIQYTYWIVSLSLPVIFLSFIYIGRETHQVSKIGIVFGNFMLILLITKLVLVIILLSEDIVRLFQGLYNWSLKNYTSASTEQIGFIPSRRKFVSQIALGLAALPFGSLLYGIVAGRYNYKIHNLVLQFKDLPDAFDNFTITQISDIHSGSFDGRDGVIKGLDLIKGLNSDLLLFTGDLVNTFSQEFDPWIEDFKSLDAKFGKYSVLGNHDYGRYAEWKNPMDMEANFERIKAHHGAMGFKLLLDESVKIEKDGQYIQILGVENWGKGFGEVGDINKALQNVNTSDFKILLSHDPTHWEFVVKKHPSLVHLTLSGHTHGMQMGIEIPGFRWSPVQYRYPKWAGHYDEMGRNLYINRGFGVLGFRGRAGIWPEITQITLQKV